MACKCTLIYITTIIIIIIIIIIIRRRIIAGTKHTINSLETIKDTNTAVTPACYSTRITPIYELN
jgi:hypothetical protein